MIKSFLKEFKVPSLYESGFENFLSDFEEVLGITKEKFYLDYEGKRKLMHCVGNLISSFDLNKEIDPSFKDQNLDLFEETFIDERIVIEELYMKMVSDNTYYIYLKGSYVSAPDISSDLNIYIGFLKIEREPSELRITTNLFNEERLTYLRSRASRNS